MTTEFEDHLRSLSGADLLKLYNDRHPDAPKKSFKTKSLAIEAILKDREVPAPAPVPQDISYVVSPDAIDANTGRPTVAQRTRALLLRGYTDEEVWDILKREYRMTTKPGYVAWYRRGMEFGFKRETV